MSNEITSALNTLVQGLSRQSNRVASDADAMQAALVAAQNQAAAATGHNPTGAPTNAPGLTSETLSASTDIIGPIVDMIMARQAYAATLVATKITADVEQTTVDMMGRLTRA